MKKFMFGLATCSLILASCSSNESLESAIVTENLNVINFNTNTTRASVNNLENVKGGFPVFAQTSNGSTWYINNVTDGLAVYSFKASAWSWADGATVNQKKWPTETAAYPMQFYAYYPKTVTGFTLDANTVGQLKGSITIASDVANQADFLGARYKDVTTKPGSGKLNLSFEHITSKINFGIVAGSGTSVFVQQLNLNNVGNAGIYNYTDGTWAYATQDTYTGKYTYWGTEKTGAVINVFNPVVSNSEVVVPFYSTNIANHLMLRPQAGTPSWNGKGVTGNVINPADAYIESVYRLEANGDVNAVGYKVAESHPDYAKLPQDKKSALVGKPLYIKVGFPFGSALSWLKGKAYTYNIGLGTVGSTGGIIIDNRYYDEKGNPTDLLIKDKNTGDQVNNGEIHFNVSVGEWADGQGVSNPNGSGVTIQ